MLIETVKPDYLKVFPTLDSLQLVIDQINVQLPIQYRNQVLILMMSYHNTLLSVMEKK